MATRKEHSDVRLVSSDGEVIYTSRALLIMISPVFRDMYDLGPYAHPSTAEGDSYHAEITLAEDSSTLKALFAYADPTTVRPPSLNIRQLFNAMSAAQKYLMEGTLERLRAALNAPTVISSSSTESDPKEPAWSPESPKNQQRMTTLLQSAPLPAAVLCHTFNFKDELRVALRELSRAHIDMIIKNNQECMLPACLFQYILKRRRARAAWFKVKAKVLYAFAPTGATGGCTHCMRYCGYAIQDACAKVDDHPCWDAFRGELQRAARCSCGAPAVPLASERLHNEMTKWETEARAMDAELPEWSPLT